MTKWMNLGFKQGQVRRLLKFTGYGIAILISGAALGALFAVWNVFFMPHGSVPETPIAASVSASGSETYTSETTVTHKQNSVCTFAEQYVKNYPSRVSLDTPGFVQYIYSKVNVKLPRTIVEQSKVGTKVTTLSELQKGDVIFFNLENSNKMEVTFDGIYLGNNTFVALTTHGIMTISMQNPYWSSKFIYGTRIL